MSVAQPSARPATKWIDSTNFDDSHPDDVTGHGMVEGFRGRKFASNGAYVGYELDFGSGVSTLELVMAYNWRQRDEPELIFRAGGPEGKPIGRTKIKQHDELADGYHRIKIDVKSVSGVQTFYMIHQTSQNPHIHVKKFRFQ